MPLLSKFKDSLQRHNLLNKNDIVVIGVSGGPDSVCLVYLLNRIQREFRLSLHIAHLNHMLRGSDSKKDADFVLGLAKRLKIPATIKEVAVGSISNKGSLEEIARKARFDFFFEVAGKLKARKIALGHNLDDQAETVLMRVVRGSGLMGLSGILPKRAIGGFTIIRPLLEITRSEIEKFLKKKNIVPRIDSTNVSEIYFRNKIRHKILPALEEYNPNLKEVLANMARNIALDYEYLALKGRGAFNKLKVNESKASLKLSLERLQKLHPALLHMALRFSFEALKGDTRRLTYQHIKDLKDLVYRRPIGAVVDLPSHISIAKHRKYLCAYLRNAS